MAFEPVFGTQPEPELILTDSHAQLMIGDQPVEAGVNYFVIKEVDALDVNLNKRTGAFTYTGVGEAMIHAVYGTKAKEAILRVGP